MWPMPQPGVATTIIDFTSGLSLLIIGLWGLLGLSVGFILFAAIRGHLSQNIDRMQGTAAYEDRRDAA